MEAGDPFGKGRFFDGCHDGIDVFVCIGHFFGDGLIGDGFKETTKQCKDVSLLAAFFSF